METGHIDLHVHSTCSDGTFTPTELVTLAKENNLCAFALTDHDCILGITEAKAAAAGSNLEVISGVELSCEYQEKEIHMVGLYINEQNPILQQKLREFCRSRDARTKEMVEKLAAAGFAIDYDSLCREYPDCVITRAHVARYLTDHGLVKDMNTVFSKYIGDNCPFFVSRKKISPIEGIALIHQAGGLAVLAHPILYHMSTVTLDKLCALLAEHGLDGIEAVYSTYQLGEEQNIKKLARKYNLLISGGSDFHGSNKPFISLGSGTRHMPIPASILSDIKAARSHSMTQS